MSAAICFCVWRSGCSDPCRAPFLDPGAVAPAEPGGVAGRTQEMQRSGLHVQPVGCGSQHAPAALVHGLLILPPHDCGAPVHRLDLYVQTSGHQHRSGDVRYGLAIVWLAGGKQHGLLVVVAGLQDRRTNLAEGQRRSSRITHRRLAAPTPPRRMTRLSKRRRLVRSAQVCPG